VHLISPPRAADERGFTLIETLMAASIGIVILLAAFFLLDRSLTTSGQVADRSEALQRARQTMLLMTRQIRSQVCLGTSTVPVISGTDSSVSFYADLSDGSTPVQKRTLTFDPAAGTITESVVTGSGTYPSLTFTGTPVTNTLLTKVDQIMDGTVARPVFRYYGYVSTSTTGALQQLTTPLSSSDLSRVAVVKVGFRALPNRPITDTNNSTSIEDDVYVREADPASPTTGPRCI
jgi:Tfp pilus assembly protein PilW